MNANSQMRFSHEKLNVYQKAIEFVSWTQELIESLPSKVSVRDQLDRASTSIPLNIAEGNVKVSNKDRARFWQIANGSAVECAACLDVIVARRLKGLDEVEKGKALLARISSMLFALLKRFDSVVIEEEGVEYGKASEIDDEDEDGR